MMMLGNGSGTDCKASQCIAMGLDAATATDAASDARCVHTLSQFKSRSIVNYFKMLLFTKKCVTYLPYVFWRKLNQQNHMKSLLSPGQ